MTVTDLDLKVRKNVYNFLNNDCVENEPWMRYCTWNAADSNKPMFDLINRGQALDMTIQRNVPRFCMGAICSWNLQFQILFQPRCLGDNLNLL